MDFSINSHGDASDLEHGYLKAARGPNGNVFKRTADGFRRDPRMTMTEKGRVGADGKVFDAISAAEATATSPLHRKLKGRHLQMIAIGGSIGMKP